MDVVAYPFSPIIDRPRKTAPAVTTRSLHARSPSTRACCPSSTLSSAWRLPLIAPITVTLLARMPPSTWFLRRSNNGPPAAADYVRVSIHDPRGLRTPTDEADQRLPNQVRHHFPRDPGSGGPSHRRDAQVRRVARRIDRHGGSTDRG